MSGTRSARLRAKTEDDAGNAEDQASDLATASHYLNARAGIKRKLETCFTVHNNPKKRRRLKDANGDTVLYHPAQWCVTGSVQKGTAQLVHWLKEAVSDLQDVYCWECHKDCVDGALDCGECPRTFHAACAGPGASKYDEGQEWQCPVCSRIAAAQEQDGVDKEELCSMLAFALKRMRHSDAEPFSRPVPASLVPEYYDLVFHPLDLSTLGRKVAATEYASTAAFLADSAWILHNAILFHGASTKLCNDARLILKIARHEMAEIELCADCYRASVQRPDNWFSDPCSTPHVLVWAKLKGFPFWPAKALRLSLDKRLVDVRFFGAHDRAWIPIASCFLLSEEAPALPRNPRKHGLDSSMDELKDHIRLLRRRGGFHYAPPKSELREDHLLKSSSCPLFDSAAAKALRLKMEEEGNGNHRPSLGPPSPASSGVSGDFPPLPCPPVASDTSAKKPPESELEQKLTHSETDDADETPTKQIDGCQKDLSNALPSQESVGLLDRIQNTIKDVDEAVEEPETSSTPADKPAARKSITNPTKPAPSSSNTPPPASSFRGNTRITHTQKSEERKRNLDLLVGRMRDRAPPSSASPTPPPTSSSTNSTTNAAPSTPNTTNSLLGLTTRPSPPASDPRSSQVPLKKADGVVITHEKMPFRTVGSKPNQNGTEELRAPNRSEVTSIFKRHADKLQSTLTSALKEMCSEVLAVAATAGPSNSTPSSSSTSSTSDSHLTTELRQLRWSQTTAMSALSKEIRVVVGEATRKAEREKEAFVEETRRRLEEEKQRAITDTKRKQWCANCGKEAVFYCCWNTSYCDYPCQQAHWPKHQLSCGQVAQNGGNGGGGRGGMPMPQRSGPASPALHLRSQPPPGPSGPALAQFLRRPL